VRKSIAALGLILAIQCGMASAEDAEVHYVITNGGTDVGDRGEVHFFPAGQNHKSQIDWIRSGGTVKLPTGAYDVHVTFVDGAVHKDFWIDNQSFAHKVEKTVEIGMPVTGVHYVITNGGTDVGGRGEVHFFAAGKNHKSEIDWIRSGGSARVPQGNYDVHVTYQDGLIRKDFWVDHQSFAGKIDRKVELALKIAEPTVTVTQNGADVGDKARVGYVEPATHDEIGVVKSGEEARLEAKTYDIHATLFGAEGWLRAAALTGKQHLKIEIKPLQTEQLKAGAPPPKACAIEVYGVNFDFDKSELRPDSEPMLKQVLALFTRTPGFSAEVGGHTDNVGKPDYNLKLSDARAATVKAWLMAHGVAPQRVTSHGYGDTRPLVPNTTDENRFKNRRVELRTAACR
jgi:outer membrane protein OmpA-like peptidoglycan-associated protein